MTAPIDAEPVDALVASFAGEHRCPSVTWGVVRERALVLLGATGTVGDAAPTERTVYRIASMTKSFSAAVTLLLRDEGELRLDEPIGTYAPELAHLRSATTDAPAITVRDLLCMSSGLVSDDPWADRHLDLTDDEFDRIVADGLVFAQPTGASHEYSNFGYALLGRVVHRATGVRLREHVTDRLLRPLGMDDTTWDPPGHDRWARPMRWLDDRFVEEIATPADGTIAPMGGLWTTLADLAIWATFLADAFPARDGGDDGPLSRASRREMQTPQRYVGQRTLRGVTFPTSYGYGLRVLDEPGGTVISHSGGLPGYGSNMRWTPGGSVGVIALSNVTYAPMTELAARIHDAVDDLGAVPDAHRAPSTGVVQSADALLRVLNAWASGEPVDAAELAGVFADNVGPDDGFDRRSRRAIELGVLAPTHVRATSDAAAEVTCTTVDGRTATVSFALSPPLPARIQWFEVELGSD